MTKESTLIQVKNITKHFPIQRGFLGQGVVEVVRAVDGVTFDIFKGETLGLVGESGCGKSTTGRTILQLYPSTSGNVLFRGTDLTKLSRNDLRRARRNMQIVFQNPIASLNPRMKVGAIVSEPLKINGIGDRHERQERVNELFQMVGLSPYFVNRYPREFSGGQCQRIGIARALALQPEFVILDEPIAALDVSIQAQVVNLLEELQDNLGLTYLFISHDLSMIRHISDRIAVMYLGKIIELTTRDELYCHPNHPYTQALLSALPLPDPRKERQRKRTILEGDVPSPSNPPSGCNFHPRCPSAISICSEQEPEFLKVSPDHWVACFLNS
jgi:oligopeptide transport system ATP-binding protein